MADYTRSVETKRSIVYRLSSPTNWVEVSKVLSGIRQEMNPASAQYDDVVTIEADADEIRFVFDADLSTGGAR